MKFFKAFFNKEWIKLRYVFLGLLTANIGMAVYLCLQLRFFNNYYDPIAVWDAWVSRGFLFFGRYQWLPVASSVILAVMQFLPEVQGQRVRLVLHLPLQEEVAVSLHLLVGVVMQLLLFMPPFLLFVWMSVVSFPQEMLRNLVLTAVPWYLAAGLAYYMIAALMLEFRWRYRVAYILLTVGSLRFLLMDGFFDLYQRVLPGFLIWVLLAFTIPLLSSYRFRKGVSS